MALSSALGILVAAVALLPFGCPARAAQDPLKAVQVFVTLSQRTSETERADFLADTSGQAVEGAGFVEAVLPRSYFDTSVPHTNPAVALIQVSAGRKVVCGLPELLKKEELQKFAEGTAILFRGSLADAQDWGQWSTLYLGECSLHPR